MDWFSLLFGFVAGVAVTTAVFLGAFLWRMYQEWKGF